MGQFLSEMYLTFQTRGQNWPFGCLEEKKHAQCNKFLYSQISTTTQKVWNQFPVMLNLNMGEHLKLVGMKRKRQVKILTTIFFRKIALQTGGDGPPVCDCHRVSHPPLLL